MRARKLLSGAHLVTCEIHLVTCSVVICMSKNQPQLHDTVIIQITELLAMKKYCQRDTQHSMTLWSCVWAARAKSEQKSQARLLCGLLGLRTEKTKLPVPCRPFLSHAP